MPFGFVQAAAVVALPHRSRNRSLNGAGGRDVVLDRPQDPEQREQHRHLDDERQAAGERVDVVLLVELHQLFVLLLLVVLVLRLELLDLRLDALHRDHRSRLLRGQRQQHRHDGAGQQDDRDAQVGDDGVEDGEEPSDGRLERLERVHGTRLRRTAGRDGIDPEAPEWVATTEAAGRERTSPQRAVDLDRFDARTASTTVRSGTVTFGER